MKGFFALLAAVVLSAALLTGCAGESLPKGMSEEALLSAGQEVLMLLVSGDYEGVRAALRDDVAQSVTVEDIRAIVLQETDGMGVYKQIDSSMTTAQTVQGQRLGVAVFSCQYGEGKVFCRLSFDADMALVGISLQQQ